MKDLIFHLTHKATVLKIIRFKGDTWNNFTGFLPYLRISPQKQTPLKEIDDLDNSIKDAISSYYYDAKFLPTKLILNKSHLQDQINLYRGTKINVELLIEQLPKIDDSVDVYNKKVSVFHKPLELILQHQPSGFNKEEVSKRYTGQLDEELFNKCIAKADLEAIDFI